MDVPLGDISTRLSNVHWGESLPGREIRLARNAFARTDRWIYMRGNVHLVPNALLIHLVNQVDRGGLFVKQQSMQRRHNDH